MDVNEIGSVMIACWLLEGVLQNLAKVENHSLVGATMGKKKIAIVEQCKNRT